MSVAILYEAFWLLVKDGSVPKAERPGDAEEALIFVAYMIQPSRIRDEEQ